MSGELIDLALRHVGASTGLPGFSILRTDISRSRVPSVLRPSLCFMVQGAKEVTVGTAVYRYRASEFLLASIDLPVTGEVIEATPSRPYLCLVLEIDPGLVLELTTAGCKPPPPSGPMAPIFIGKTDELMSNAFLRLLRCLDRPMDVQVLAPSILREITYRVLSGPHGHFLRDIGVANSQAQRIAKVIERLKRDFHRPLRMEDLAHVAGMSLSSFHAHFRRVTTLSPLQYQKQLRLQEARRLLLARGTGAADVAFEVGYESASQFSREYAALFGLPPMQDLKRSMPSASSAGVRAAVRASSAGRPSPVRRVSSPR